MSITSITVAGSSIDLANVELSVIIYHRRNDIASTPAASTAQLSMLITGQPSVPIGLANSINIQAYDVDRFTGTITDLQLEHLYAVDGTPMTFLTMLAVGSLSLLGSRYAGDAGFPSESLSDRLDAILSGSGLTYTLDADAGITLNAYPAGHYTLDQLLLELGTWTGGTMYDAPDGRIWWESYTRRGLTYSNATWDDELYAWSNTAGTWDNQLKAGSAGTVVLPADAVTWSPSWDASQSLILNDVTVTYGTADPQASQNVQDAASITRYGLRALTVETGLANSADASTRAQTIITSQSQERWQLGKVEVLVDELTPAKRTEVLALLAGGRVVVPALPQPAPIDEFYGVVEGWGETYTADGHRLVLSLSDPRFSSAMCSWAEVPPAATWGSVPAPITWADVVVPSDLAA